MRSSEIDSTLTTSNTAQGSGGGGSATPTEDHGSGSVRDFLYHDVRRITSFLAQFHDYGVLQQVKATESVGQSGTSKTVITGDLGVPLVAKGTATMDGTVVNEERDAAERTYDPFWTNAQMLLSYLSERGMIRRDIEEAAVGQFVLVAGQILLLDLAMLKSAWEKPPIQRLMKSGIEESIVGTGANRSQRRAASAKGGKAPASTEFEVLISLLSMMPHAVQVRLIGEGVNVWCTLDENSIVGLSSNLILKHGALIGGEWKMLGVLDAIPYDPAYTNESGEGETEIFARIAETMVGALAAHLGPVTRSLMGRPPSAYGVTPLLIYRDVTGGEDDQADADSLP